MTSDELRAALDRLDLSQADLGRLTGVTSRAVNLWATGDRAVPGPIAAYLRLFETLPTALRKAELARLKEDEPMLKEGMYGITYSGSAGVGMGMLVLENGRVFGADAVGGKYDGSYAYNSVTNLIESSIKVTIPPGVWTVQGMPAQPFEWSFNVRVAFTRGVDSQKVKAETDVGPVSVEIKYLRPVLE